jgi:hypothetical protein
MTINPIDVGTKFNYLGRSRFSADPLFSGRFDDFRFVSSALTEAQVAAIASTPPPQFRSTPLYKPDAFPDSPTAPRWRAMPRAAARSRSARWTARPG